jgi:hypothetical protein
MFEIMAEFVEATERLAQIRPAVSIFGSARTARLGLLHAHRTHRPQAVGRRLRGDFRRRPGGHGGGQQGRLLRQVASVGLNIQLPHEQRANPLPGHQPDLPPFLRAQGHVREVRQRLRGHARRLRHAGRVDGSPDPGADRQDPAHSDHPGQSRVLGGLVDWFRDTLVREGMIDPDDMDLIQMIDEPEGGRRTSSSSTKVPQWVIKKW